MEGCAVLVGTPTPWTGRLAAEDCASEAGSHALVASTHDQQGCLLLSVVEICLLYGAH